jgi:hypothetical protein
MYIYIYNYITLYIQVYEFIWTGQRINSLAWNEVWTKFETNCRHRELCAKRLPILTNNCKLHEKKCPHHIPHNFGLPIPCPLRLWHFRALCLKDATNELKTKTMQSTRLSYNASINWHRPIRYWITGIWGKQIIYRSGTYLTTVRRTLIEFAADFLKMVESDMDLDKINLLPTVIVVQICVYTYIYTQYCSNTQPPTPCAGWGGALGWVGVLQEYCVYMISWFCFHNPDTSQRTNLNRRCQCFNQLSSIESPEVKCFNENVKLLNVNELLNNMESSDVLFMIVDR